MSWVVVFGGLIALIILHELGHFTAAKAVGMRVERFSLFFPPLLLRKKVGETEYTIGALPLGGYVKISGMSPAEELPDEVRTRAYYAQPPWKRIVVIAAGPAVNLVLAFVLLFVFLTAIGVQGTSTRVGTLERSYPAFSALKLGDKIVSVDGKRGDVDVVSKQIATHKCAVVPPTKGCKATTPAHLVVDRKGHLLNLTLTPIYDPSVGRTRLGFGFSPGGPRDHFSASHAVSTSASLYWDLTKQTLTLPARIFNAKERKQISGIVGVSDVAHQTISHDWGEGVYFAAVISLILAIVNLFPFLPLDGGHIFWAVVEKLRQRPVPYSVMERAGVIGFMLVIFLFLIGFTNDVSRLTGGGFNVR
jgi:regulator of sigma E protease